MRRLSLALLLGLSLVLLLVRPPAPSAPSEGEQVESAVPLPAATSAAVPTATPRPSVVAERPAERLFDATSVRGGQLWISPGTPEVEGTDNPARASIDGRGRNSYARAQWTVRWGEGTVFRAEASFLLPSGFYANMQGAVQLMGWDTWPVANNQMRLIIWNSDRKARLFLKSNGQDSELTSTFSIPEGRWVDLAIEQKISNDDGWSRVYLDGNLVAEGSGPTATPYPVTRMRYGLVAIAGGQQRLPLSVYFDRVHLSRLASG